MRIRSPEKDILTPDQSKNMKFELSMSSYPSLKGFTIKFTYLVLILIYDPKTTGVPCDFTKQSN